MLCKITVHHLTFFALISCSLCKTKTPQPTTTTTTTDAEDSEFLFSPDPKLDPFAEDPFLKEDYVFLRGHFYVHNLNPLTLVIHEIMHTMSTTKFGGVSADIHDNAFYDLEIKPHASSKRQDFDYQTGWDGGKDKWSVVLKYNECTYEAPLFDCDVTEHDQNILNMTVNLKEFNFIIKRSHSKNCETKLKPTVPYVADLFRTENPNLLLA